MKILITGAGRGGLSLAIHLQGAGHEVTILDRDSAITQRAADEHGIVALVGDATSSEILRQAEPQHADAVLAMLHRDADNLAVAMLARTLGARRVMVRMRESGLPLALRVGRRAADPVGDRDPRRRARDGRGVRGGAALDDPRRGRRDRGGDRGAARGVGRGSRGQRDRDLDLVPAVVRGRGHGEGWRGVRRHAARP